MDSPDPEAVLDFPSSESKNSPHILDNARLYDVFISGPIYIYFSYWITETGNYFLTVFVLLTGIMTILFNLHNYLLINRKELQKPILPWTDPKEGKYQIHRVYNLFVMYPLLLYANIITPNKPRWLTVVLYLMIFIGILFQ